MPRSAWTDTAARGSTLTAGKLVGCSVHWPGTTQDRIDAANSADIAVRLRGYRNHHVNVKGWSDIGYQVAIDEEGRVWDCRGITRVPAASASATNTDANWEWGACLLLLGDEQNPSTEMVRAFQDWRADRWLKRWPKAILVRGHQQVPGASTACPGARTMNLIRSGDLLRPLEDDMPTLAEIEGLLTKPRGDYGYGSPNKYAIAGGAHRYAWGAVVKLGEVQAELKAQRALLAQLVAAHGPDDLTAERVDQIVRAAIAESVIDVDVTVRDDTP